MQFLKTYRRVKDVFVKPKIRWYFGSWKNEPNLPVWRCGPQIFLTKYIDCWGGRRGKAYYPENRVKIFEGYSDHEWNGNKIKKYGFSEHKLPGKLTVHTPVWNRNIRKKLRKWHLSWISPRIQLPIWLTFRFDDSDVWSKFKWDEVRYEYPSYICLVLFGFAISITAYFPEKEHFTTNDDYWECILNYDQILSIEDLNERMGRWENLATGVKRWKLVPEFLKEPYRTQLIAIQNEFNETEMDGIS